MLAVRQSRSMLAWCLGGELALGETPIAASGGRISTYPVGLHDIMGITTPTVTTEETF